MAGLATAANIFAVVGLADILFRNGKELYDSLQRLHNAPSEIKDLLEELRDLESIIACIRIFIDDFNNSPFSLKDGQVLTHIEAILEHCQFEFDELQKAAIAANDSSAGVGWLPHFRRRVSWVLDAQKIRYACSRLERQKTALIAALSITEGSNSIVFRKELQATQDGVVNVQDVIRTGLRDMDGHLVDFSTQATENFCATKTTIEAEAQRLRTDIEHAKTRVDSVARSLQSDTAEIMERLDASKVTSDTRHIAIETSITQSAEHVARGLSDLRDEIARMTGQNQLWLDKILAHFEGSEQFSLCNLLSSDLFHTEEEDCLDLGLDLEALTLPFMLMKNQILATIQEDEDCGLGTLIPDTTLVLRELDAILSTCHRASSQAAKTRVETHGSKSSRNLSPSLLQRSSSTKGPKNFTGILADESGSLPRRAFEKWDELRYRFGFERNAGTLTLVANNCSIDSSELDEMSPLLAIQIIFAPTTAISQKGITATFTWEWTPTGNPRVTRSFKAYNILPRDSLAIRHACQDNVAALEKLVKAGTISPSDYDGFGRSLLMFAANNLALRVFDFLLCHSAKISDLNEAREILSGIWHAPGLLSDESEGLNRAIAMTKLALKYRPDCRYPSYQNPDPMHLLCYWDISIDPGGAEELIELLLSIGCDINSTNSLGYSPLLAAFAAPWHNLPTACTRARLLISKGANPLAVDLDLRSALHILFLGLSSHVISCTGQTWNSVEIMLSALLGAGCDPNALDCRGSSPTDYVLKCGSDRIRQIWAMALTTAGYQLLGIHINSAETVFVVLGRVFGPIMLKHSGQLDKRPSADRVHEQATGKTIGDCLLCNASELMDESLPVSRLLFDVWLKSKVMLVEYWETRYHVPRPARGWIEEEGLEEIYGHRMGGWMLRLLALPRLREKSALAGKSIKKAMKRLKTLPSRPSLVLSSDFLHKLENAARRERSLIAMHIFRPRRALENYGLKNQPANLQLPVDLLRMNNRYFPRAVDLLLASQRYQAERNQKS